MADAESPTTSALATRSRPGRGARCGAGPAGAGPSAGSARHARSARHGGAPAAGGRRDATPRFPTRSTRACASALASRGVIGQLYTHQAEAIEHALAGRQRRGHHADGVGQDALLQRAGSARDSPGSVEPRAVSVPDQGARAGSARRAADAVRDASTGRAATQIGVFTYDGDTPQDARRTIRSRAHLVLSNPDMLHSGILPHHPRWAKLFENLRYVIIDELHAYRGVFGSHLCNVLRRLRRICRHYGSNPVFLCSSATIANPRELAERLTEQPFELVDEERRAARREVLRVRQSAGRQSSARDPALVSRARRGGSPRSSSSGTCS